MEQFNFFTLPASLLLCLALLAFGGPNAFAVEGAGPAAPAFGASDGTGQTAPVDSLAFAAKRRQILERNPGERITLILEAAEDMARDGFYTEALDLIFSLEDPKAAAAEWDSDFTGDTGGYAPAPESPSLARALSGSVQTVLDYDEWEGLDTSVNGRVRMKLDWDPRGRMLDRLSGVFQGSDRNAYFELSTKGSAGRRMLKFEADAQAEKKLWQTYGDSLDRFYLLTKLEGNTRALGKPLSVVTPVFAEVQQYRYSRFGSQSYRVLGATPGLEAISGDLRKSLILSWEFRHSAFPGASSEGNIRNGPVASMEWYGNRVTVDAETRFQAIRYFRDTSRYRLRELETRGGAFVRTWSWLRAGARTFGSTETGDYLDSVSLPVDTVTFTSPRILAAYQLKGSVWRVQPQLIADWTPSVSTTLSLGYTQARFPILAQTEGLALQTPKYLEESYDDWKPAIGVTVLTKAIFFTFTADYAENWVRGSAEYSVGSSRGLGLSGDLFWKIRPWLEIDVSGVFALARNFGPLQGRMQDMRSLSLGLITRLP